MVVHMVVEVLGGQHHSPVEEMSGVGKLLVVEVAGGVGSVGGSQAGGSGIVLIAYPS